MRILRQCLIMIVLTIVPIFVGATDSTSMSIPVAAPLFNPYATSQPTTPPIGITPSFKVTMLETGTYKTSAATFSAGVLCPTDYGPPTMIAPTYMTPGAPYHFLPTHEYAWYNCEVSVDYPYNANVQAAMNGWVDCHTIHPLIGAGNVQCTYMYPKGEPPVTTLVINNASGATHSEIHIFSSGAGSSQTTSYAGSNITLCFPLGTPALTSTINAANTAINKIISDTNTATVPTTNAAIQAVNSNAAAAQATADQALAAAQAAASAAASASAAAAAAAAATTPIPVIGGGGGATPPTILPITTPTPPLQQISPQICASSIPAGNEIVSVNGATGNAALPVTLYPGTYYAVVYYSSGALNTAGLQCGTICQGQFIITPSQLGTTYPLSGLSCTTPSC
jgi:hypothetical protein